MNNWLDFLAQQSATIINGQACSFGETADDYAELSAALCDLSNLGIMALEGPDTERFLQGQSTNDITKLDTSTIMPGAICNPKGRMLTSYYTLKPRAETLLLVMDRLLVNTTLACIQKYAAFFKTELTDATTKFRVLGICGPACEDLLAKHFKAWPEHINQSCTGENYLLSRISEQQFLLVVEEAEVQALWLTLSTVFKPTGINYWHLHSIRAGRAQVQAETTEQFIPQMLNLQATGAISFKKGCYTGQEIVARMQYLGKLKRHTYRLVIESASIPTIGLDLYRSGDGKSIGTVVAAALTGSNSCEVLAVLQEDHAALTSLLIDDKTVASHVADLPYSLAAD